jgi:cell division protein FtsW
MVGGIILLMIIGVLLVVAASPPVAKRNGYEAFHFVNQQYLYLSFAIPLMFFLSILNARLVRLVALMGLGMSFLLMVLVLFWGSETKGAARWISLFGFSLQPSEFMKPCFAIVNAWIFSLRQRYAELPCYPISTLLYLFAIALLALQPDFGMMIITMVIWAGQLFLAGLPMLLVAALILMGIGGGFAAYFTFDHVKSRVDRFLDPQSGDNYQVERSLEAFANGGIFGKGPGEGLVKMRLPDCHTDFIYAVAGEEFGIIACLLIAGIFLAMTARGMITVWQHGDYFRILAVGGLLIQFSMQALVNMGVAVNILPAKGMTLPFISYGGSSLLAMAVALGIILALTRKHFGKGLASNGYLSA